MKEFLTPTLNVETFSYDNYTSRDYEITNPDSSDVEWGDGWDPNN